MDTAFDNPSHLVVVQHGLWGSASHVDYLAAQIRKRLGSDAVVHAAKANEYSRSSQGIQVCGDGLVEEILEVASRLPSLTKFSIFGYSLGGLISRYAIGKLLERGFFDRLEPTNLVMVVSPIMGVRRSPKSLINRVQNFTTSRFAGLSGREMLLEDNCLYGDGSAPLLFVLAHPGSSFYEALKLFRRRTCYANALNDQLVPFCTASLSTRNPYVGASARRPVDPRYPHVIGVRALGLSDSDLGSGRIWAPSASRRLHVADSSSSAGSPSRSESLARSATSSSGSASESESEPAGLSASSSASELPLPRPAEGPTTAPVTIPSAGSGEGAVACPFPCPAALEDFESLSELCPDAAAVQAAPAPNCSTPPRHDSDDAPPGGRSESEPAPTRAARGGLASAVVTSTTTYVTSLLSAGLSLLGRAPAATTQRASALPGAGLVRRLSRTASTLTTTVVFATSKLVSGSSATESERPTSVRVTTTVRTSATAQASSTGEAKEPGSRAAVAVEEEPFSRDLKRPLLAAMHQNLTSLPWMSVHAALPGPNTHGRIIVTRPWLTTAGADVVQHMVDHLVL